VQGRERTGPEDRRKAKQKYKKGLVGKGNAEEILRVCASPILVAIKKNPFYFREISTKFNA